VEKTLPGQRATSSPDVEESNSTVEN